MSQTSSTLATSDGALRLWSEIVRGLRGAGYKQAVPEYLKLSRMLSQTKMTELVKGQPEAAQWTQLRELAREALESLAPLAEAARILAELPSELRVSEIEPVMVEAAPEVVVTEPEIAPATMEVTESLEHVSAAEPAPDAPAKPRRKRKSKAAGGKGDGKMVRARKKKIPETALSGHES